ncbi:DUF2848 family protein [Lentzea sp. NPDC051208]|uniref:DUF2848 family protein n=1 Tax=Lentzea sp. NPDC051208 TaxID=3154642 RepID=UPI00343B8B67
MRSWGWMSQVARVVVPTPSVTPSLYPVSPHLAQQTSTAPAQHGRTSGEAEGRSS